MECICSHLFTTLLAGGVAFLIWTYFRLKSYHNHWKKLNVPFESPTFLFGNYKDVGLGRKPEAIVYKEFCKKFANEKFFGFYNYLNPVFVPKDPELVKQIMVKDFDHFHDRGVKIDFDKDPLSEHLVLLSGDRWKFLRSKLTPAFTSSKIKMMFNMVHECGDEVCSYIDANIPSGTDINVRDLTMNYTTDSIASCAFGVKAGTIENGTSTFKKISQNFSNITPFLFVIFQLLEMCPSLVNKLNLKITPNETEDMVINTFMKTIEEREKMKVKRPDFIDLVLQIKTKGNIEGEEQNTSEKTKIDLKDTTLAAQAYLFIVAGLDTSSQTLTFVLYFLSLHPEIQEKLREEVKDIIDEHGGVTYEAISNMKYMGMVIDETLRLYPPAHNLIRIVTKPYTVPGTNITLENGTRVRIPVFAMQRDPSVFPEPDKFDPERFSEENKAKRHPFSYMPFGEGPRMCIGTRFAQMQMRVLLSKLITKFKFEVCAKTPIPMIMDPKSPISFRPRDEIWLKIRKL